MPSSVIIASRNPSLYNGFKWSDLADEDDIQINSCIKESPIEQQQKQNINTTNNQEMKQIKKLERARRNSWLMDSNLPESSPERLHLIKNHSFDEFDDKNIKEFEAEPPAISVVCFSLTDYKERIADIMMEFFTSYDCAEASRAILELSKFEWRAQMIKKCISMAMDQRDKEREATSQLLVYLCQSVVSLEQVEDGFLLILHSIQDLMVDVPHAYIMLAQFMARAIDDGLLSPLFLSKVYENLPNTNIDQTNTLTLTRKLLEISNNNDEDAVLHTVWGPGDGRPVAGMKEAIDEIVEDYLVTNCMKRAIERIQQLDAPHFLHEVVKRTLRCGLDHSITVRKSLWNFIVELHRCSILSSNQITLGIDQLFESLSDLVLDTPYAENLLHEYVEWAQHDHCVEITESNSLVV